MSTEPSHGESSDTEVVRAAATRSLAARGVRLYRARTRETDDGGWTDAWSWEVGVADPAARSVRVRHFHADGAPLEKLTEAVLHRWPWLGDETPPPDPDPRDNAETIEIGRTNYYGGPDRWIDWSDMPFYGPARVLWPLEAILGATTADRAGSIDLRGEACARFLCKVLPGNVARLDGIELVDSPEAGDDRRELSVDVCIDLGGLVRRVMWSPTTGKRFKPGLLPRLAAHFDKSPPPDPAFDADGRLWNLTEFWDYGCEIEISAPTNLIDSSDTSMLDIANDLWRMRRKYKQQHDRP
jgi:hypothetical protein